MFGKWRLLGAPPTHHAIQKQTNMGYLGAFIMSCLLLCICMIILYFMNFYFTICTLSFIFQVTYSTSGSRVLESILADQGARWEPTLKTGRHSIAGLILHTCPHSLILRSYWHVSWPNMHIFGMFKKAKVPWENPRRHGEAWVDKLHADSGPGQELIIFLINVIMKWQYSLMLLQQL